MVRLLDLALAIALAMAACAARAVAQDAGVPSRPNILVIISDDHAATAISAYGSQLTKTPNIDRIAAEGLRFDRCYVTNSICGPSRACILTGKYSHKNGYYVNDREFDGSQPTFPKMLQRAGYQTALIGKWHLGVKNPPTGFDYWQILEHQGFYYQPRYITPLGTVQYVGYTTDLITDQALAWLERGRDPDQPFLLMVQHKAPHRPWDPGPKYLDVAADRRFPEPANLFDDYANRASAARMAEMRISDHMDVAGPDLKAWDDPAVATPAADGHRDWLYGMMTQQQLSAWKPAFLQRNRRFYEEQPAGKELTRWKYQRYLADYLDCVASIDDGVGRLLDYLDAQDLADNTLVIYASDQGMFLGEHGWFDKRFMYEESLRTPLVVRWPGAIKAGGVDDHIVSNLDFAETLLDVAGVAVPSDMQGKSFAPLLRGESPEGWRQSFYYHYYEGPPGAHNVTPHYGVTTGRHKLIHYYKLDEWELFDLQDDPHEMRSRYGDPAYAEVQARLLAELERLRAELDVESNDPPS